MSDNGRGGKRRSEEVREGQRRSKEVRDSQEFVKRKFSLKWVRWLEDDFLR